LTIFTVSDAASFYDGMHDMVLQRGQSHTINITASFTMTGPVAPVVLDLGQSLTVNGGGFTITAATPIGPSSFPRVTPRAWPTPAPSPSTT
jgi:hypothetical protein